MSLKFDHYFHVVSIWKIQDMFKITYLYRVIKKKNVPNFKFRFFHYPSRINPQFLHDISRYFFRILLDTKITSNTIFVTYDMT